MPTSADCSHKEICFPALNQWLLAYFLFGDFGFYNSIVEKKVGCPQIPVSEMDFHVYSIINCVVAAQRKILDSYTFLLQFPFSFKHINAIFGDVGQIIFPKSILFSLTPLQFNCRFFQTPIGLGFSCTPTARRSRLRSTVPRLPPPPGTPGQRSRPVQKQISVLSEFEFNTFLLILLFTILDFYSHRSIAAGGRRRHEHTHTRQRSGSPLSLSFRLPSSWWSEIQLLAPPLETPLSSRFYSVTHPSSSDTLT